MDQEEFVNNIKNMLEQFQKDLFERARSFRDNQSYYMDDYATFKKQIEKGGFYYMHWCESPECEAKVKEETKATIRCIPLDAKEEEGTCIYCGKPSHRRVIFARAY